MHDIGVFLLGELPRPSPWILMVVAAVRHPVVADADDMLVLVDDAGADLRMRILAAVGGKERHAHKILIP